MSVDFMEVNGGEPESPGVILRRLREAKNLSIAEVAQRLKYGSRQIEALERDDFDKLPGMTFVRGIIRGYARLLGADPEAVLRRLESQRVPDPMTVDLRVSRIPFPDGKKRTTRVYIALSVLLIIVATMVGYELLPWSGDPQARMTVVATQEQEKVAMAEAKGVAAAETLRSASKADSAASVQIEAAPLSVAPVAPSVPVANPVLTPAPAAVSALGPSVQTPGSKKIALQFDRESWVEIRQANGKTLLSQLNPGGSKQVIEGIPPFVLIIGNAPNVHLSYNDQPVDLRPYFKVDVARLTLD